MWRAGIHWDKLAWYAEEKARRGAFATLLAVDFSATSPSDSSSWNAVALGDSCLFHVRQNTLLRSFPLLRADEFGTTPSLISTNLNYSERSLDSLTIAAGECHSGDLILMSTDALAAWLLSENERGSDYWKSLSCVTQDEFSSLVKRARDSGEMRNDDVTLAVVECCKSCQ